MHYKFLFSTLISGLIGLFLLAQPGFLYAQNDDVQKFRSQYGIFKNNPQVALQAVNSLGRQRDKFGVANTDTPTLVALIKVKKQLDRDAIKKIHIFSRAQASDINVPLTDRIAGLRISSKAMLELMGRDISRDDLLDMSAEKTTRIDNKEKRQLPLFHAEHLLSAQSKSELDSFRKQLRSQALDAGEDADLRRFAIRSLGQLGNAQDKGILKEIVESGGATYSSKLRKEALMSLRDLKDENLETMSVTILDNNDDSELVTAAAYILGHIETDSALSKLVENIGKYNKNSKERPSFEAGIYQHIQNIEKEMFSTNIVKRRLALKALKNVQWAQEDLYKPDLKNLLNNLDQDNESDEIQLTLDLLLQSKLKRNDCYEILNILDRKGLRTAGSVSNSLSYLEECSQWISIEPVGKVGE